MKLAKRGLGHHLLHHRKKWILLTILFFASAVGVLYCLASLKTWSSYEQENITWQKTVTEKAHAAFNAKIVSPQDKEKQLRQLDELHKLLAGNNDRCRVNPLYEWQQLMQMYRSLVDSCRQFSDKIATFNVALNTVLAYLADEQKVAAILQQASSGGQQMGEADLQAAAKRWTEAANALGKLKVSKSFEETKKVALDKITTIRTAWDELVAANTEKNRAKYEQADATLTRAYGTLDEIVQSSQAHLAAPLAKLDAAYAGAFKKP